jgi:hypothetical protein
MSDENKIYLKDWNAESCMTEPTGETVSIYAIARSITPLNLSKLLESYLNLGGKGFNEGKLVGLHLRHAHRTLQRLAVCFVLGLIAGISEQEHFDGRNEEAIKTAKKLAQMMKDELPLGFYL